MSSAVFRNVVREDLPHLEHLFLTCFNAPPWNDGWSPEAARERLQDILDAKHFCGAIAFIDAEPVGMLVGRKERWIDSYHFNLIEMCVHPSRRRQGIGRALVQHLLAELDREQSRKVYLITVPGGTAETFYAKLGFYSSRGLVVMARNVGD